MHERVIQRIMGIVGLPPNHAGFLSDLQAMQCPISVGSRPKGPVMKRLNKRVHPLLAERWMELLVSAGVCTKKKKDANDKLYAAVGTQTLALNDLLIHARNDVEKRAIRCFYPQVRRAWKPVTNPKY